MLVFIYVQAESPRSHQRVVHYCILDPVPFVEVEDSIIVTVDGVCLLPTLCCASDSFDDIVFVPLLVPIIKYTPPSFVLLTTYETTLSK